MHFVNYFYTVSGALSLLGSLTIIYILIQSNRQLNTCHRRLVFGMSVFDILASALFALCFVPRFNEQVCSFQGFIFHLGVTTTPMYNASLCIYYVSSVVFEIDEMLIKRRLEPFLHGIPICWNVFAAIFLTRNGSINETGVLCWIGSKPLDCLEDPNMECERGENADKHRWMFVGYQTFAIFFIIVISMIMLVVKLAKQERRLGALSDSAVRNDEDPSEDAFRLRQTFKIKSIYKTKSMKKVVSQAFVYVAAYFFPFLFPTIHYAYKSMAGRRSFVTWVLMATFMPLQGLFNSIVFIRPRFIALRHRHPEISFLKALLVTTKFATLAQNSMRTAQSTVVSTRDSTTENVSQA